MAKTGKGSGNLAETAANILSEIAERAPAVAKKAADVGRQVSDVGREVSDVGGEAGRPQGEARGVGFPQPTRGLTSVKTPSGFGVQIHAWSSHAVCFWK